MKEDINNTQTRKPVTETNTDITKAHNPLAPHTAEGKFAQSTHLETSI